MRVLPADVYDALELSALAFGGIGAGHWWDGYGDDAPPLCIMGHALAVDPKDGLRDVLIDADITAPASDRAVRAINARKGEESYPEANRRVTFRPWCAELGVVRGE